MVLLVTDVTERPKNEEAQGGGTSMMPRAAPRKAVYGANMMLA
jgi:hypothetical protein